MKVRRIDSPSYAKFKIDPDGPLATDCDPGTVYGQITKQVQDGCAMYLGPQTSVVYPLFVCDDPDFETAATLCKEKLPAVSIGLDGPSVCNCTFCQRAARYSSNSITILPDGITGRRTEAPGAMVRTPLATVGGVASQYMGGWDQLTQLLAGFGALVRYERIWYFRRGYRAGKKETAR